MTETLTKGIKISDGWRIRVLPSHLVESTPWDVYLDKAEADEAKLRWLSEASERFGSPVPDEAAAVEPVSIFADPRVDEDGVCRADVKVFWKEERGERYRHREDEFFKNIGSDNWRICRTYLEGEKAFTDDLDLIDSAFYRIDKARKGLNEEAQRDNKIILNKVAGVMLNEKAQHKTSALTRVASDEVSS